MANFRAKKTTEADLCKVADGTASLGHEEEKDRQGQQGSEQEPRPCPWSPVFAFHTALLVRLRQLNTVLEGRSRFVQGHLMPIH